MIRQLFDRETSTFTYLVADPASNLGLLIDPVLEQGERDMKLAYELGVTLKYAVNTHVHADHVTSSGVLKQKIAGLQSVLGRKGNEMALADVKLDDGDVLEVGAIYLEVRHNPGHTAGCYSFVLLDNERPVCVFTGDAVLIRGCGRTDFQGGNSAELYRSVHAKILSLPDETIVFPAHDCKGLCCSTVGEEKRLNPRLNKTLEEFIQIMAGWVWLVGSIPLTRIALWTVLTCHIRPRLTMLCL
jgi:sulfur dioxygenase